MQRPASEEIIAEVNRLSALAAWPGCPNGGWQYPHDLGDGIVTPTYTDIQKELHPFRRELMKNALMRCYGGDIAQKSAIELGCCEGAMSFGLADLGVKDITAVEFRDVNVLKAKFIAEVCGYQGVHFIKDRLETYLAYENLRTYDICLFMGILYHVQDPFWMMKRMAKITREVAIVETVITKQRLVELDNRESYQPDPRRAFYIRYDNNESQTAGPSSIELWPTEEAVYALLEESGFKRWEKLKADGRGPVYFDSDERLMLIAYK